MGSLKVAAIILILAGAFGLAYGSFTYTKGAHEANMGPIKVSIKDKETINIPVWAGISAIVLGGFFLLYKGKKA